MRPTGFDCIALRPGEAERRPAEKIVEEVLDLRPHRSLQGAHGHLAGELVWIGSLEYQRPFAKHPTDVYGVAMG